MTDPNTIQAVLIATEDGKSHVCYDSAAKILPVLCSGGVLKYDGVPVGKHDGPAVRFDDGKEFWFKHGEMIRGSYEETDGSKVVVCNGGKWHIKDMILHRENGPAYEGKDGSVAYYVDGVLHNDGGPAIILADGTKEHFRHGKRHRENGPAVEFGSGRQAWFVEGKRMTKSEFSRWREAKDAAHQDEASIPWVWPAASIAVAIGASLLKIATKPKPVVEVVEKPSC